MSNDLGFQVRDKLILLVEAQSKFSVNIALRICCEENILMPFLASRQKEVQDIIVTLFKQERVTEIHEYNLVKDAREEGLEKGICAMALTLKEFTADKAAVA